MTNKITIEISELKSALPGFSKIINKRSTLPVLGFVLLKTNIEGQLQITATNLDDYASYTLPCTGSASAFQALIPFECLCKLVKGCDAMASLTIEADKDDVRITYPIAGTILTERVPFLSPDEFPAIPSPAWQDSITVGSDFKEAIHQALDSASQDVSRYVLNHAFVDVSDPDAHYVVGTDGKEMFAANSFKLGLKESLIVPNRKFLVWKGFMEEGDWRISLPETATTKEPDPNWIRVQSDRWTLITKQVPATYPQWRAPIPTGGEKTIIRFNEDAQRFITLAAPRLPGAGANNSPVSLQAFGKDSLILFAKGSGQEVSVPVTGVTVSGKPVQKSLNRDYLLKAMKLGLNELEVFGEQTVVVFRNGGKRLVVACLQDEHPLPEQATAENQEQPAAVPTTTQTETSTQNEKDPEDEMKTTNRIEPVATETITASAPAPGSGYEQLRLHLETVKETLRGALGEINDSLKLLAQAQRERRATEKEVEEVRATLQSLQKIRI